MKKLLLGTIVLLSFCLAGIIFQISCTKNSGAQPNPTNIGLKQLNKILYEPDYSDDNGSGIYIANYDGSNSQELTIPLPSGMKNIGGARLSPDGKTIFFFAWNTQNHTSIALGGLVINNLYSGSLNGNSVSNVTKVIDGSNSGINGLTLDGVY